jgi:endonuclease/exonuclease/phosphatase family metal-dependent hydrolase
MKKYSSLNYLIILFSLFVLPILNPSCVPTPVEIFDKTEKGITIEKAQKVNVLPPDSTIRVMTWNIRFGIGRGPWFGDACGYKVVYTKEEILNNLQLIADKINLVQPDILLLQEVDQFSTRSGYVDELRWILDNTYFNYASYGSQWNAQFIPSDGLGKLQEANVVYSRWPITESIRKQLALRTDQISIERYFYERCCLVTTKIEIPGFDALYVVNTHASAFATDNSKHLHLIEFKDELDSIARIGGIFVGGGDLNELPPGSDSTDYCYEDKCEGESYHQPGDKPLHKDGSWYTPENEWLVPIYTAYKPVVPLSDYLKNQSNYFTHTTRPEHFWDRTLDYLFTNSRWKPTATIVHQDFRKESDHAPISGELYLKKK